MKDSEKDALKVLKNCNPLVRSEILYQLRKAWWGEERVNLQEDILDRYDNSEYWDPKLLSRGDS
ncbi:MAG: hypothetical protein IEMM0003_0867 [bacterium]|nr:MAG: hypothetical protein IEMM0003_0867 [bacterium]